MNLPALEGKNIVVWFSCGAASAVALSETIKHYGHNNKIIACNNPIKEEDDDNQRFLKEVSIFLNIEIIEVRSKKYPAQSCIEVWDKRKYMSGVSGAPCTGELKKKARQEWEKENDHDYIVLGFTSEERKRHENFVLSEREDLLPVLISKNITKKYCYEEVNRWGIELPRMYGLGYPNANCIGCVKATSPTYWNHVREKHPETFKQRAEQSRRIGSRLVRVKGERLFLDELPVDAKGRAMKNMDFECGIFCEEKGE